MIGVSTWVKRERAYSRWGVQREGARRGAYWPFSADTESRCPSERPSEQVWKFSQGLPPWSTQSGRADLLHPGALFLPLNWQWQELHAGSWEEEGETVDPAKGGNPASHGVEEGTAQAPSPRSTEPCSPSHPGSPWFGWGKSPNQRAGLRHEPEPGIL